MTDLSSQQKPEEPVAVFVLRTVKPGFEDRFEAKLSDFINRSLRTEGQLGVSVMRPVQGSGSREYGILRRFRDPGCRDRFYESPLFREWEVTVAALTEGEPRRQEVSGLETWFVSPGQSAVIPPPRWKMALVTVLGVWPTSIIVSQALNPFMGDMPVALQALLVAGGIVILLTWVIMPMLVRLLKPWL